MAERVTVGELARVMGEIAPERYAEPWDNVGLLAGDPERGLGGPVLLTIDLDEPVMAEAEGLGCGAIVAYHPPLFVATRRLDDSNVRQRIVRRAIEAKMALYSPHTALDAAPGGVTDWLADGVLPAGEPAHADRRALTPWGAAADTQRVKIVTFVPSENADAVRDALASAGAGIIGRYEGCSFSSAGEGTFLGATDTHPAVGSAGAFVRAAERRLEMVCSRKALALALATLRRFHPYEEPAIDVYALEPQPERSIGAGRRLVLDQPASLREIAGRLKGHLGAGTLKVAAAGRTASDLERPLTHVGVCPGAGASLAPAALADGCHVYVTGEMKHHEVMGMLDGGMSVVLTGHTTSERGYLPRLAARLNAELGGVDARVSAADRHPFEYV